MNFRIADTFTDSLGRLIRAERKTAKATAFDLQLNSENPSLCLRNLEKTKSKKAE